MFHSETGLILIVPSFLLSQINLTSYRMTRHVVLRGDL